jgi:hypothetical protein
MSFCRGTGAPLDNPARQPECGCHLRRLHHRPCRQADEDCLYELSISMFLEAGCLHVYGVGEVAATAFTHYGIEC